VGAAVLGLGDNTAIEVRHSSIGSLTWLALAALLPLTSTPHARGSGGHEVEPFSVSTWSPQRPAA
jgi:hypothetical protein